MPPKSDCRFDLARLKALAEKDQEELALLLQVHAVEGWDSYALVLRTLDDAAKKMPECYRVLDSMCDYGGIGTLPEATVRGFEVFGKTVPDRLRKMPGLPAAVTIGARPRATALDRGRVPAIRAGATAATAATDELLLRHIRAWFPELPQGDPQGTRPA